MKRKKELEWIFSWFFLKFLAQTCECIFPKAQHSPKKYNYILFATVENFNYMKTMSLQSIFIVTTPTSVSECFHFLNLKIKSKVLPILSLPSTENKSNSRFIVRKSLSCHWKLAIFIIAKGLPTCSQFIPPIVLKSLLPANQTIWRKLSNMKSILYSILLKYKTRRWCDNCFNIFINSHIYKKN